MRIIDIRAAWPLLAILVVVVLLFFAGGREKAIFARLLGTPLPKNAQGLEVKANDVLGLSLTGFVPLESTYFMKFSADAADIKAIVQGGGFRLCASADASPGGLCPPGSPPWWKQKTTTPDLRLFQRQGKYGEDYIWIDKTGTNVFYMLWNI